MFNQFPVNDFIHAFAEYALFLVFHFSVVSIRLQRLLHCRWGYVLINPLEVKNAVHRSNLRAS